MAVIELESNEAFDQAVQDNDFVLIDFWAPWCGPCRSFAPIYEKISEQHKDIFFSKVNTEDQQELGMRFQIRSIPTLMIFREQVVIYSEAGMLPEPALNDLITRAKSLDMDKVKADIAKGNGQQQG